MSSFIEQRLLSANIYSERCFVISHRAMSCHDSLEVKRLDSSSLISLHCTYAATSGNVCVCVCVCICVLVASEVSRADCESLSNRRDVSFQLQHTATHCNAQQHTRAHSLSNRRDVSFQLQHTATHCNAQQHTRAHSLSNKRDVSFQLQHSATHCNTLHQ